jgi:hypothetical protein
VDEDEIRTSVELCGARPRQDAPADPDRVDERVVERDARAGGRQLLDDLERGRLTDVGDAGLVRHAHHVDVRPRERAAAVTQHLPDPVGDTGRPRRDLRHGRVDERGVVTRGTHLPGQVVRVARDAVPTHARAWAERHEAVGLRVRGVDHLVDGDVEAPRDVGHLVGERDVDRTEGVLEQLGHLGDLRRADPVHGRARELEQGGRALGARAGDAADDARRRLGPMVLDARVDALRRERDMHVTPDDEAATLERLHDELSGAADVARRGEDDELTRDGVLDDAGHRRPEHREVRDLVIVDRGRDAHDHHVGPFEGRVVVGELEVGLLHGVPQPVAVAVRHVDVAVDDPPQPGLIDVEADHRAAGLAQAERGRQSDVPETDDRAREREHGPISGDGVQGGALEGSSLVEGVRHRRTPGDSWSRPPATQVGGAQTCRAAGPAHCVLRHSGRRPCRPSPGAVDDVRTRTRGSARRCGGPARGAAGGR